MRFRSSISLMALLSFCCAPAALAADCPYYGGHVDVGGKLGNERDIGETSVFIPMACSKETLLFSDFRFKDDDEDNREGNFGLGVRSLHETGVLGGYAYFDRKLSGVTDKYHSQMTLGSEWLTEDWEVRANGYIPLTGDSEITTGSSGLSDPFLAGSGIFAKETAQKVLREIPLYGGDVEAGIKIPDTNFWLHAAAFSFDGNDAPSMNGVRARATFQITDNIALTAEGQYDNERGRQEWIGARFTLPFGSPAQKPEGVATRMTASPVRDVDIVTKAKTETKGSDRLIPVLNAETGAAQRVIYVDNSAAVNGNGSLNKPFNNLTDAQNSLRDHDVLYIASGTGDSTGMDNGLSIAHKDVQVIGEGSAFVYDNKFTTNTGNNFTGTLLRAAGAAPVLTNQSANGDGVTVGASDVLLTGLSVENAARHGIYVDEQGGEALNNITLSNLSVTGSGEDGIRIEGGNAGSSVSASLIDVTTAGNKNGIRFYAHDDASVSGMVQSSLTTANAQHGVIVYDDSAAGAVDVDLGGGGRSEGNNALFGNHLEDLALDIDGGTLSAQNNWWGQSSGLYQSAPSGSLKPQIYYGAPIDDGLVVNLTFDTEWTDGTTAYDRSGNGHNGTLNGGVTAANLVAGKNGEALQLDGIDDYVQINSTGTISGNSPWTIQVLGNVDTSENGAGRQGWYLWEGPSSQGGNALISMGVTGQSVEIAHFANDVTYTNAGVAFDDYQLVSATFNGATETVYTNGISRQARATPLNIDEGNWSVASRAGATDFLKYKADDVRIYDRALTSDEIAQLYRMDTTSAVDFSSYRTTAP